MKVLKDLKIEKHIGEGVFVLAVSSLLLFAELSTSSFAQVAYYTLTAGNKVIAIVKSEAEASQAIKEAEHHYVSEDAKEVSVNAEPSISVEQKQYGMLTAPRTASSKAAAKKIIKNAESDEPDVRIRTTETVTEPRDIDFDTVEKESDKLIEDAVAVDTEGVKGEEMVTRSVTTLNGEEVSSEEIASEVVAEPEPEVVLTGTRKDDEEDSSGNEGSAGKAFHVKKNSDGKTFSGDLPSDDMGRKVADYALNFVGNPYVWGGESLEKGADCSGFVLAVYKHFGISLPHNANTQRNYGNGYTLKTAKAGDLICYDGHIGIYIGNNQIVHAMDHAHGMTVSTIGYNHKKILGVRRLFDK